MSAIINHLGSVANLPNFGEGGIEYFGQTFVAGGSRLNSITFVIDSTGGPDATEFNLLVVDTELSLDGFDPGSVLFESSVIVQPVDGDSNYQFVTVDIGGLAVTPGQTYAFLLDAFVAKDGQAGVSQLSASHFNASGSNYVGGHFVSLDANAQNRAFHFASGTDWLDWDGSENGNDVDMSFSISFTEPTVITSNNGAETSIAIAENTTAVTTVTASDADSPVISYSIIGGADAAKFAISATGVVSFVAAPDFEKPTDQNGDNIYDLIVQAADTSGNSDTQTLHVSVADVVGVTISGKRGDDTVNATKTVKGQPLPTALEDSIFGKGGNDKLSGLGGADLIDGGKGDDKLRGGDGDDRLIGGKGEDKLSGEAGADAFLFNASLQQPVDKISDFSVLDDTVLLAQAVFKTLGLGVLAESAFHLGKAAADADDRILYGNGELLYDRDGTGNADAVVFAKIAKGLSLTHLDFEVVA